MYPSPGIKAYNQELERLNPRSKIYSLLTGNSYPWLGSGGVKPRKILAVSRFGRLTKKKGKRAIGWCVKNGRVVRIYKVYGKKGRRYANNHIVTKGKRCYRSRAKALSSLKKPRRKARRTSSRRGRGHRYLVGIARKKNRFVNMYCYDGSRGYYYSTGRKVPPRTEKYFYQHVPKSMVERSIMQAKRKGYIDRSKPRRQSINQIKRLISRGAKKIQDWEPPNEFGSRRAINPTNKYNYQLSQYSTNVGTPTLNQLKKISRDGSYSYPINSMMRHNHAWYKNKSNLSGYGF